MKVSNENFVVFNQVKSTADFKTVRQKILDFIAEKNLTVFAEFDHAKNAHEVDLELNPTTVIVFGSPLVGTKLMQNFFGIGMELPLRVQILQDDAGQIFVAYPNLTNVFAPYGIGADHEILGKMNGLLQGLAKTAIQ